MADFDIQALSEQHDRGEFSCGKAPLDAFIRTQAGQQARKDMSRTFVVVRRGELKVIGYYTVASSAIAFEEFPVELSKKLPRHPIPGFLVARLAVDSSARGQGLGGDLIFDALRRSVSVSEQMGIHVVHVHAKDDEAAAFYQHYKFQPLPGQPHHLFLPLRTIRQLVEGSGE